MKKMLWLSIAMMSAVPFGRAHAQSGVSGRVAPPVVFQGAGPTVDSIAGVIAAYRTALGATNNGNNPGPLTGGRREINWDGGSVDNQNTSTAGNPFAGFQFSRGALFSTPDGTGFVQAPAIADATQFPPGGLAGVFGNPSYGTIFTPFSRSRLFSAIGGRVTDVDFFVPSSDNVARPATTSGFGAVFTDVDRSGGSRLKKLGNGKGSTRVRCFDIEGELLFSGFVPASPGDGSLSFLGVVFDDARIAHVRITSGNATPGADDDEKRDVVMMDDFLYGEPQPLQ